MTPRRRQLYKPLARGSHCSLAQKCLQDHRVKKYITKGFGISLRKDIAGLCSDISNLTEMKWEDRCTMFDEVEGTNTSKSATELH